MFYQSARKVVVFVVGFTVLAIGIALIVLPGPAFIVIPAGLAILATEFVWAKLLLKKGKDKAKQMMSGFPVIFSNAESAEQSEKSKP